MKKKIFLILILILNIVLIACNNITGNKPTYLEEGETRYISRINDNRFQVFQDNEWRSINIKAVNMKNSIPPSLSEKNIIDEGTYLNWIKSIGEMNANTIKVDDICPPEFYKALAKYNKDAKQNIYLLQGIAMNMEFLKENPDPFMLDNIIIFKEKISKAIDIIHGKASDEYKQDISPYVLGWILGSKWEPTVIANTNKTRTDKGQYEGNFFLTEDARPFEHFLAEVMDYTLSYEMDTYGWQHPISFYNSAITDPLSHPYEPTAEGDFVSIDPNKIKNIGSKVGQFAFYNVYPYDPEFLNLDPRYTKYIDHRGKTNNYAGYIHDLVEFHELPILIDGFGISSSRVMSRISVHNWNNGGNSEESQGNILAQMYEDIIYQGGLGGIVADWKDEWVEKSWSNIQNPEENLGLLTFESQKITIDGSKKDWKALKSKAIYESEKKDSNLIKNVYMEHDERYLYMGIEYKKLKHDLPDTLIFLDTIPNQGNHTNPFNENIETENGTDFIIHISKDGSSEILVDGYYDPFYYEYGHISKLIPLEDSFSNRDSEQYSSIRTILDKNSKHHRTGLSIPFSYYEIGRLKYGNGNPTSEEYNSISDYSISEKDSFLEIRIPWALINFVDPSDKVVLGDIYVDGIDSKITLDGINVSLATYDPNNPESFHSFPKSDTEVISSDLVYKYTWDKWNTPNVSERLKKSYHIIKEVFNRY